jgi:tripartite-type tricarboxylate transporter receptor subunit TctC
MLRRFVIGAATALLALSSAHADTFPSKTITMIVGVAPGGTLDTLARLLAKAMTDDLKRTVIVENTVGAGGLVGLKRLMSAPADGHTLMFTNMSLVIIPHLHPTAGVNPSKDLDALGLGFLASCDARASLHDHCETFALLSTTGTERRVAVVC